MSAFECFQQYNALKLHFTKPEYDYFRYNGKSRVSSKSFDTRKDKLFFMKLAKHNDPVNYILSNLLENNKLWVRDLAYNKEAEDRYKDWQKRQQSLTYVFTQELSKLNEDFDTNFKSEDHNHPYVVRLFLQKEISLETLVVLVDLVKCQKYWSRKHEYDPVIEDLLLKIQKYRPFLHYDNNKIKQIVLDKFSNISHTK
jgi:hypothetical protein